MPLNENDLSYFIDIVDCIIDINEFTRSVEYYQLTLRKSEKKDIIGVWEGTY